MGTVDQDGIGVEAPSRRPDPVSSLRPRVVGVVDANALLSSIHNQCKTGWPTYFLRMQGIGTAKLYAADHVFTEVYKKLPRFVGRAGTTPTLSELRACFEEQYLPLLRFATISEAALLEDDIQLITDADDRPTGALAKLVAPCLVFSEDRDLRRPGFAPERWRESAGAAADVATGDLALQSATAMVGLPAAGAVYGTRAVAVKLEVSPWLLGGAFAAVAAALLSDRRRRSRTRSALAAFGSTVLEVLAPMVESQQRGLERLREDMYYAPANPSTKQLVAAAMARSSYPLLPSEISDAIESDRCAPTASEIRTLLSAEPEFLRPQGERYRWELGRHSAPWTGTLPLPD